MTISRDSLLVRGYQLLITGASSLQSLFLLAVRLYWGWQFMQAGWGKLHRMPQVIDFFAKLHIPAPAANAWFVALLEKRSPANMNGVDCHTNWSSSSPG